MDVLLAAIVDKIPLPKRNYDALLKMSIIRSFDVNKPSCNLDTLTGGVVGVSILQGIIKIDDIIEIKPGITTDGINYKPFITRVISLVSEKTNLQYAVPGGLIAIGTSLDPSLTRGDKLVGQVIGIQGTLPNLVFTIKIKYQLIKQQQKEKIDSTEIYRFNIGSCITNGNIIIHPTKKNVAKINLKTPVCIDSSEKVSISKKIDGHWRLIGFGNLNF